jgi:hypothetical protein
VLDVWLVGGSSLNRVDGTYLMRGALGAGMGFSDSIRGLGETVLEDMASGEGVLPVVAGFGARGETGL